MDSADRHVSTGQLPSADEVAQVVDDAHRRFATLDDGAVSDVYPALARVDPALFGIAVVGTSGAVHAAGDADHPFALMSVAKPFTLALVAQHSGFEAVRTQVGVNATGRPFNSVAAAELSADGRTNPMVNAGAIATVSMVPGTSADDRWELLLHGLSRFAGRPLSLDEEVYTSASSTNFRNRSIAEMVNARGGITGDPDEALDLYTRQSSVAVTARDLAVMGATLAAGGLNPLTAERVVDEDVCHDVLAVMVTAGMYETSGDWLCDVGLPGKSGIGGGIVTVSPGKGGLGTFSPRLDAAGNSVRGQQVAAYLSRALGLDLFASRSGGR